MNILSIIFNIFILLVETLYFYIPLKEIKKIKSNKNKLFLYIGIFISNIISVLIFGSSIFRYILYIILICLALKFLSKKIYLYDLLFIAFITCFKLLIEFIIVFPLMNILLKYYTFIIIFIEILSIILINLFKKFLVILYKIVEENWNSIIKFYIRYLFIIFFNCTILFFIFNLIKIKEVL